MDSTKIRTLYDDYMALSSFFYSQNQISFATCINDVYRKSLLERFNFEMFCIHKK